VRGGDCRSPADFSAIQIYRVRRTAARSLSLADEVAPDRQRGSTHFVSGMKNAREVRGGRLTASQTAVDLVSFSTFALYAVGRAITAVAVSRCIIVAIGRRGRGNGSRFGPVPAATLSLVGRENPAFQQPNAVALVRCQCAPFIPLTRPELIVESLPFCPPHRYKALRQARIIELSRIIRSEDSSIDRSRALLKLDDQMCRSNRYSKVGGINCRLGCCPVLLPIMIKARCDLLSISRSLNSEFRTAHRGACYVAINTTACSCNDRSDIISRDHLIRFHVMFAENKHDQDDYEMNGNPHIWIVIGEMSQSYVIRYPNKLSE